MLPSPRVESPSFFLTTTFRESGAYSASYPAIQHSAWRAADGSIGIVLTNIGDQSIDMTLPIDFDRLGLSAGSRYAVRAINDRSDSLLDPALEATHSYGLTIPPRGILLVTVSKP
jgi:hypothetical protein